MRFLLDEDVNPGTAEIARGLGLDVLSVHEINRREIGDEEQLRFATSQHRIFVTRNRDDFLHINLVFFQVGESHAGLLIVPRSLPNKRPERIAHALKRWQVQSGDPGPSFIAYLSP
jgi:predicted nuclease of predicted toxin-antitoxin system